MLKTVIFAVGTVAASATFLSAETQRFLQNTTTWSTACSVTGTTETGCWTQTNNVTNGYCCVSYTKNAAAGTPPNICIPFDLVGSSITVGSGATASAYVFGKTCLSSTAQASNLAARTASWPNCTDSSTCGTGKCCSKQTSFVSVSGVFGNATTGNYCSDGNNKTFGLTAYTTASWNAANTVRVTLDACTPNAEPPAESFSAILKSSVMIVVALFSVFLF